jgi:hypothetical protein
MKANFKFDSRKFRAAVADLAALAKKKPVQQVMKSAAGQVIRKVVDVTPPAKGKADKASQTRGELAITSDLAKIATPVVISGPGRKAAKELLTSVAELLAVHQRSRTGAAGRVNPRSRKEKLLVDQTAYNKALKDLFRLVGTLAAGWNKAAEALGVKLPAWIRRHGDSHGIIRITVTNTGVRIFLANNVGFVDNVKDLERRLQWALDTVAKNIVETQIPNAIKSQAKRAGFKAR